MRAWFFILGLILGVTAQSPHSLLTDAVAADIVQQSPTTFSDRDFQRLDGTIESKSPPATDLLQRSLPDIASCLTVINEGFGDQPQKLCLDDMMATADGSQHNNFTSVCSVTAPCLVPAEAANSFNIANGGGSVYLNLQALAFYKPYLFTSDGTTTTYLDPGKDGQFQGWGTQGKLLRIDPGETLVIFRRTGGLYHVHAGAVAGSIPGGMPHVAVTTVGDFDLPSNGGAKLFLTNAATNFTIGSMPFGVEFCAGNKSGGTGTIQPGGSQILLPQGSTGTKLLIPPNGVVCFVRWTTGIWIITRWVGTSIYESTVALGSAVPLTVAGTAYDITFLDLPPGRWNITGAVVLNPASGTTSTSFGGWTSTVSATAPSKPNKNGIFEWYGSYAGSGNAQYNLGPMALTTTVEPTTRVYLSGRSTFTGSTSSVYGYIRATQY